MPTTYLHNYIVMKILITENWAKRQALIAEISKDFAEFMELNRVRNVSSLYN